MRHFDYIFCGSGLSALMTVHEILKIEGSKKAILLLDTDLKKTNDRTWSFWEKPNGDWEDIVFKKWEKAWFKSDGFEKVLDLSPFEYKTIQGKDFYKMMFERFSAFANVTFENSKVLDVNDIGESCTVVTENETLSCEKVFNSILYINKVLNQDKFPLFQQHFIGWAIETSTDEFDDNIATFMDFSVEQKGNTRFMYVLPFSKKTALFEYTLFSAELLETSEYENAIVEYLKNLGNSDYTIIDKERGNIPMTSYEFWNQNTKNIINIGSAGGWTKASTGFTFKHSEKKSKALAKFLLTENDFTKFYSKDRFWFFDLLFIDVLFHHNEIGSEIFASIFKKLSPEMIFRFLDNETTIAEDLNIIWACPKVPFLKALVRRVF